MYYPKDDTRQMLLAQQHYKHADGLGLLPCPKRFWQLGFFLLLAWFRQNPQPAGEARR
jgi:hypothetical protein